MKKFLTVLIISSLTLLIKGQPSCNPTTIPADIFYPNSTNSPTATIGYEYLCGPNTTVYDTLGNGCHYVYVNAGTILFFKNTFSCAAQSEIWLKNNGILNLVQGAGLLQVYFEPGAIINNPYSVTIATTSCSSISFPTVNCSATGIKENNFSNNIEIYPNPANDKLNIKFTSNQKEFTKAQIINSLGILVKETDLTYNESKPFITIADLPNGVYILNLKSDKLGTVTKKFVVDR